MIGDKKQCLQNIENWRIDQLTNLVERHNDKIKSIMDKNYSGKEHKKKVQATLKELEDQEKKIEKTYDDEKRKVNSRYNDLTKNVDKLKFGWVKRERETAFTYSFKRGLIINPSGAFSNLRDSDIQPEFLPPSKGGSKFLPPADGDGR